MAVFHERYPRETLHWVEITDTLPDNCAVYNRPADCWFVPFLPNEFRWRLISSRLVAISKSTREIVYDGDAGDEGKSVTFSDAPHCPRESPLRVREKQSTFI
jgi:hypothetical protein